MNDIGAFLNGVKTIAVAAHVNPDGDAVGSCLGIKNYLADNYPELTVDVYMRGARDIFGYIRYFDELIEDDSSIKEYDLMILCDISSTDRIGAGARLVSHAKRTLCLDHHITNKGGFTWFYNFPDASSASEVIYGFLKPQNISKECAEALYTGIVHDTGVFQYTNTGKATMEIAGALMAKGVDFNHIIDRTFFEKTFSQRRISGKVSESARLYLDGRVIAGVVTLEDRKEYRIGAGDTEGIVSELRSTKGVEAAIFLYQLDSTEFKISLRSCDIVNVAEIAAGYGGGGHIKAAGCKARGKADEIIDELVEKIGRQLKGN